MTKFGCCSHFGSEYLNKMDLTTFLTVIALVHSAIYFTDQLLKSCLNIPYLSFLENVGLTIKPLQLRIFTTLFNRPVTKWGFSRPRFFRVWFTLGAVIVILMIIPSIFILIRAINDHIWSTSGSSDQAVIQPVIPGVNFPVSELPYYFVILLLASIIHEAGHAMAAVREDVHISGFGFLFLYVIPGAYVDIPTEGIKSLSPFKQLKILCAGVWHNIVLVVLAMMVCYSLPYLSSPMYIHGQGVSVLNLTEDSPARGATGLEVGNIITNVNGCPVKTVEDWRQCLLKNIRSDQIGFCIPETVVNNYDETIHHAYEDSDGSIQCCNKESSNHLCFELLQDSDTGESPMHPFSCLPARISITSSSKTCTATSECTTNTYCLAPSLKNISRLLQLTRTPSLTVSVPIEDVLYLGPPSQLYHTVTVTGYIPRLHYMPLNLPSTIETLCDYMIKFSAGLGILNLVPCVYLDGYWIAGSIIDLLLQNKCDAVSRRVLHVIVTIFGTTLLFVNIILGLKSLR